MKSKNSSKKNSDKKTLNKKKERLLFESFRNVRKKSFFYFLLFDFLTLFSFIILLGLFNFFAAGFWQDVQKMDVTAKEVYDTLNNADKNLNNEQVDFIKSHVDNMKNNLRNIIQMIILIVALFLFISAFVFSFFQYLNWKKILSQKFKFMNLLKFFALNLAVLLAWFLIVLIMILFFKIPLNIIFAAIVSLFFIYFLIPFYFIFLKQKKPGSIGVLKSFFSVLFSKKIALVFLIVVLGFILFLFCSFLLVYLSRKLILLVLILFLLFVFWSRDYYCITLKKFNMNKKAQITVFLIICILILIITGFVLYLRNPVQIAQVEKTIEVPFEAKPVQQFVESCIGRIAKDAFVLVGTHGGYVDMKDEDISGRNFKMDSFKPTSSDAATLSIDDSTHIAYWWFLDSQNNCLDCHFSQDNKPPISSVENQVNKYLVKNINSCFDNFNSFEKQGFKISQLGEFVPKTVVTEKDVVVSADFPLEIAIGEHKISVDKFITRLPLNFKKIYEFAGSVAEAEIKTNFLEQITLYLISMHSGADMNRLPPIYVSEDSYIPKVWSKSIAEMQVKSLLTSYVPLIQINNTKGAKNLVSDFGNLYKPFFLNILNESLLNYHGLNYSVHFFYLNWPVYFEISPSDGESIGASRIIHNPGGIGPFDIVTAKPTRIYEYFYDVSAPVVVEVRSDSEFYGEGYTFLFALESNLRKNRLPIEWFSGLGVVPVDYSWTTLKFKSDVEKEIKDPAQPASKAPILSKNYSKTLFCNPKQRISGNITIKVKDKTNGSLLSDVDIIYSCADYATCNIGRTNENNYPENSETFETSETSENSEYSEPSLTAQLPVCVGGGILNLKKEGYLTKRIIDITTLPNQTANFEFEMQKIYKKKVSVKKNEIKRVVYNDSLAKEVKFFVFDPVPSPLSENDMVIININKIVDNSWDVSLSKFILLYGNDSKNNDFFREIELAPGKYDVHANYFLTSKLIIPPNCSHMCDRCLNSVCEKACRQEPYDYYKGFCGKCEVDIWQPEKNITIDNQILGGFETNESKPWIISESDLAQGSIVEFHIATLPPPRCIDDIAELKEADEFYESQRYALNPKFI